MTNNTNENNVEKVNATGVFMGIEQHGSDIKILVKSEITAGRYVAGEVYEEWISKRSEDDAKTVINSAEGKGMNKQAGAWTVGQSRITLSNTYMDKKSGKSKSSGYDVFDRAGTANKVSVEAVPVWHKRDASEDKKQMTQTLRTDRGMVVTGDQGAGFRDQVVAPMLDILGQEGGALKARMEAEIPELQAQLQQATEASDFEKAGQLKKSLDKLQPALALALVKTRGQWNIMNEMQNPMNANGEPKSDLDRLKETVALIAHGFGSYGVGNNADAQIRFHDNETGRISGFTSARVTTMSQENNYQVVPMGARIAEDGSLAYTGVDGAEISADDVPAVINAVFDTVMQNQQRSAEEYNNQSAQKFIATVEGVQSGNIEGAAPGAITLEVIGATDLYVSNYPKGTSRRSDVEFSAQLEFANGQQTYPVNSIQQLHIYANDDGRVDAFIAQAPAFDAFSDRPLHTTQTFTSAGTDFLGSTKMLNDYATARSQLYNPNINSRNEMIARAATDRARATYGEALKGHAEWVAANPDGLAAKKHAPQPAAAPEGQIGEPDYNATQAPNIG